ncbi:hypothetical protein K474DRAFT_625890 [Panus rudis PR-1116 ss-1]|nr:hypothetical protein K474DRAFT_625890 [Panus rudis PR-1116 ss-1]
MNVRDHSLKSSPQLPPLELQRIPASALGPKFTHMVIRCERAPMWEIVADNERGLTCWDVFKALWDSFRTPLTDEELAILRSQPQHANKELDIRADVLGHCCIFIGLRVNANGDAWDLMLGKDADPKGLNIMRRRR